jgi:signal transduction histidine kinase/ActR/RegA family two-component response regulator
MLASLRRSLWAKILAVVVVSTFVALVVSTVALLFYELYNYRSFMRTDLSTQADILARMTAPALQFDNPEDARASLALLESRRGFDAAALYDLNGAVVATYSRPGAISEWPDIGTANEIRAADGTLELFHPVIESDNLLGTIYLRASYDVGARAAAYLTILVTVMGIALVAAALISIAVVSSVTGPLQSVTRIARRVIDERDFSLRAVRTTDDEVGVLVDAFNAMLQEVGELTAELRLADRRKDEFLATLAHELRNPMAPMMNSLSLFKLSAPGSDTSKRGLSILERQLSHLARLVDDLLDVSRITSGKLTIRKRIVGLREIVQSAVETVQPQLTARSHPLSIEWPESEIFVSAEPGRLAQVLANLLNNAIKFSDPGTGISIVVTADDERVRIAVTDKGVGIAPEATERIFEMFSQGETTHPGAHSGLGVGLALARQLTALHDGTISVASDGPGSGATFTISIPRAPAATAEHYASAPVDPASQETADLPRAQPAAARLSAPVTQPTRVLLVDDNVDFASSLAQLLEALGHDVRVAHDGAEALRIARDMKPDIGILDIGLPDIGGHDLARLIREQAPEAPPVLIAVSGWGQEEDKRKSLAAGFSLHLVKPVDYRTIQDAMRRLRQERRA